MLTAAVLVLTSRRTAATRWLFRAGAVAAALAVAGVNVRCDRPLNIAVMIDVSPSTRGAAFRDEKSVRSRLTPLLAGRPYTVHYFADGEQPTFDEPACERTRFPVPTDADAVVLMSDGRFELPAATPPVFAVIDPALDRPNDAAVRDITAVNGGLTAYVVGTGDRELRMTDRLGNATATSVPPAGPGVAVETFDAPVVGWRQVGFGPGDAWPENDTMRLEPATDRGRRIAIGLPLPGFENVEETSLLVEFTDASVIVLPAGIDMQGPRGPLYPQQIGAVLRAVRDGGTTLVIVGPPGRLSPLMRPLSPLGPLPPDGPQSWTILLDASGSMAAAADGRTRWSAATAVAREALARLPTTARVTVMAFAADVRMLASDVPPAVAAGALAGDAAVRLGGPTGLRTALESLAARAGGPSRVLLLSDGDADLGDTDALAATLNRTSLRLYAFATTPSNGIGRLCRATGGASYSRYWPEEWSEAVGRVVSATQPVGTPVRWPGRGAWAGSLVGTFARWPAYLADGADLLAGEAATPVAAMWNVGVGRVAAVAGDLFDVAGAAYYQQNLAALAETAIRLERPPVDPRFVAVFDERTETVRLTAIDVNGPLNRLSPILTRDGVSTVFQVTGPGGYVAPLPRRANSSVAQVLVDGRPVARRMLAGRYPAEFDAIGNNRNALDTLARRSGGAVIDAGDNRPIVLTRKSEEHSLREVLGIFAALLWLAGLFAIRTRR